MPLPQRLALACQPGFSHAAVEQISGLAYSYRGNVALSSLVDPLDAGPRPQPRFASGARLHDLLRHRDHTLLHITGAGGPALSELSQQLTVHYAGRLRSYQLDGTEAARLYGEPGRDVVCLVRP